MASHNEATCLSPLCGKPADAEELAKKVGGRYIPRGAGRSMVRRSWIPACYRYDDLQKAESSIKSHTSRMERITGREMMPCIASVNTHNGVTVLWSPLFTSWLY